MIATACTILALVEAGAILYERRRPIAGRDERPVYVSINGVRRRFRHAPVALALAGRLLVVLAAELEAMHQPEARRLVCGLLGAFGDGPLPLAHAGVVRETLARVLGLVACDPGDVAARSPPDHRLDEDHDTTTPSTGRKEHG
jgi:hypothetical protein